MWSSSLSRALRAASVPAAPPFVKAMTNGRGRRFMGEGEAVRSRVAEAAVGLGGSIDVESVCQETLDRVDEGATGSEIARALVHTAKARAGLEPEYGDLAARLLLSQMYAEALGYFVSLKDMEDLYPACFGAYLREGVRRDLLDPRLLEYDVPQLAAALRAERDLRFSFVGVQTVYDRYLLQDDGPRIELPQWFWMRIAMGLALAEDPHERDRRAIEFYQVLSTFAFCSSALTLLHAGTLHPQLSSCFLTTVPDDVGQIFKSIRDDALLARWSGGLGNDWTNVRALGSRIVGANGRSQGVIPFLKVANDTAVAVKQRENGHGALCAYLETWHLDIEEFLELHKRAGDERRRTHDMHTAHWIPDLFMKRVWEDRQWTLFSPSDVPDLHDLYGAAFELRYAEYEALADSGALPLHRRVRAVDLWWKMLAMLLETGYPWLTWKDASNLRSQQDHVGVVHSSNLCTDVLLNTSSEEVAVCDLGSVNLAAHIRGGAVDREQLARTVSTAVRMLDNVIDINMYPIPEARAANVRHRPIGLGMMGFQDALHEVEAAYASEAAVEFADETMELLAYHAIKASATLAAERGAYPSYAGSKWDRGMLPIDTLERLEVERGVPLSVERGGRLDWLPVREAVLRHGMRNSHVLAIAPTGTISDICGISQSIEPTHKNLSVRTEVTGALAVPNRYLVNDLQRLGLWDEAMLEELRTNSGSVQKSQRVPAELKERYRTAFEVAPEWLIRCASRRQKWIDMGQSLTLYLSRPNVEQLSDVYLLAWESGLKTTYHLLTAEADETATSKLDLNRRRLQPRWTDSLRPTGDDGPCIRRSA